MFSQEVFGCLGNCGSPANNQMQFVQHQYVIFGEFLGTPRMPIIPQ